MSTQSGRRRANVRQYSAEDQALNQISKEAEDRLAAKRAARAEAREIRMKEIERQKKEAEEKEEREGKDASHSVTTESVSKNQVSSIYTGSDDEVDSGTSSKDRDYKAEVRDLEDKYKKAMMTSAQLDNEKQSLVYQVDLLKDKLEETEETFLELQREYKEKSRDLELQKRNFRDLQMQFNGLKELMAYKDKLIEDSGLMVVTENSGELVLQKKVSNANGPSATGAILLSSETLELLDKEEGSLDEKLRRLALEKKKNIEEIKKLKEQIDEFNNVKRDDAGARIPTVNGPEMQLYEIQREASKTIHEYKFKLQKAEQDITTLEGMVNRLETQVKRYKSDAERAESMEDELKTEKRKLQRELREAQSQVEELQNQNKHLNKRLEKIKQARNALAAQ